MGNSKSKEKKGEKEGKVKLKERRQELKIVMFGDRGVGS